MSEASFSLALKSTIDKIGYDMAQAESPPIKFVDLDNVVNTTSLLKSDNNAFVWELTTLQVAPADPLYMCMFTIGARTVNDPANYGIMSLIGKLKSIFNIGQAIDIHNYSGAVAGPKEGFMVVTDITVLPQQFDRVSGIRMVNLKARVQRLG